VKVEGGGDGVFIGLELHKIGLRCYFSVLLVIKCSGYTIERSGLGLQVNIRLYYRTFDYPTSNVQCPTQSFEIQLERSSLSVRCHT
jgi:hypothetical protein